VIYKGCNTIIQYLGLTNQDTGAVVNNADVDATLLDSEGATVTTIELNSTGSNGNYKGQISSEITTGLQPGANYYLDIVASVGGIQVEERKEQVQVTYRGLCE
jgi:hypothetical protein